MLTQLFLSKMPLGIGFKINHYFQYINGAYSDSQLLESIQNQFSAIKNINNEHDITNKVVLELGPGWTLIGAIGFSIFDAKYIICSDQIKHINAKLINRVLRVVKENRVDICRICNLNSVELLRKIDDIKNAACLNDLLKKLRIVYLAPSNAASLDVQSKTVDIYYSYGVLEHIKPYQLKKIIKESRRIIKKTGISFHSIGLHDHYTGLGFENSVNFLRFSSTSWNFWTGNPISYHNRLRASDFKRLFTSFDFKVLSSDEVVNHVDLMALNTLQVDESFSTKDINDLAISAMKIFLKPNE